MTDYKKLYHRTFNALNDAEKFIKEASDIIQKAKRDCEDVYAKEDEITTNLRSSK